MLDQVVLVFEGLLTDLTLMGTFTCRNTMEGGTRSGRTQLDTETHSRVNQHMTDSCKPNEGTRNSEQLQTPRTYKHYKEPGNICVSKVLQLHEDLETVWTLWMVFIN